MCNGPTTELAFGPRMRTSVLHARTCTHPTGQASKACGVEHTQVCGWVHAAQPLSWQRLASHTVEAAAPKTWRLIVHLRLQPSLCGPGLCQLGAAGVRQPHKQVAKSLLHMSLSNTVALEHSRSRTQHTECIWHQLCRQHVCLVGARPEQRRTLSALACTARRNAAAAPFEKPSTPSKPGFLTWHEASSTVPSLHRCLSACCTDGNTTQN